MSGSLKYLKYDADDGSTWAHLGDESNHEAIVADDVAIDVTLADVAAYKYWIPGNIEPRRATYKSADGLQTRKMIVPTPALYQDLASGAGLTTLRQYTDANAVTFTLVGLSPERIRPVVIHQDTGLQDGDVD